MKPSLFAALGLGWIATIALQSEPPASAPPMPFPNDCFAAQVVSVHDGDTANLTIHFALRICAYAMPLRLQGVFAPELKSKDGVRAQEQLAKMIPPGTRCVVQLFETRGGNPKQTFARPVAQIWRESDGVNINSALAAWLKSNGITGGTGYDETKDETEAKKP